MGEDEEEKCQGIHSLFNLEKTLSETVKTKQDKYLNVLEGSHYFIVSKWRQNFHPSIESIILTMI